MRVRWSDPLFGEARWRPGVQPHADTHDDGFWPSIGGEGALGRELLAGAVPAGALGAAPGEPISSASFAARCSVYIAISE